MGETARAGAIRPVHPGVCEAPKHFRRYDPTLIVVGTPITGGQAADPSLNFDLEPVMNCAADVS